MITITIEENTCSLSKNLSISVFRLLDEQLSFKDSARAYSNFFGHGWDGQIHLLSEDDLSFPLGLLDRVCDILKSKEIEYNIINNKIKSEIVSIDIYDRLKELKKTPREYQIEVAAKVFEKTCGIMKLPTGTGKTLTSALMIANLGKKTIYYVTGTDLLYQSYDLFKSIFGDNMVGIVGDGLCDFQYITVASVWTIGCALGLDKNILLDDEEEQEKLNPEKYAIIKEEIKKASVHILDECSYVACSTIQTIYKNICPEFIFGMSASPWRDTGDDLLIESVLGKRIVDMPAKYFIDNGYLVQPVIKFLEVPEYHKKLENNYKNVYRWYIAENKVRNEMILEAAKDLINKNYKLLILYSSIKHGKILYEMMENEFPCVLLAGKDKIKVRQEAKKKIENGEVKAILASRIFDLGMDCPILSGLILASGGKSSIRALQRIGRVIRPYPNKKIAAVVDFIDNALYVREHSLIRKSIYESEEGFKVLCPKKKD